MTDWLDQHIDGKTLYVVSDLHMGDGSAKDNFAAHQSRFDNFLSEVVEQDDEALLVLAGDVFEFWQSQHGAVVKTYLDLLKRLVGRRSVFLVGNHDIDLWGFIGMEVGTAIIDQLAGELILRRGNRTIRICHGHEFDKYNDPGKAMVLGKIATLAAGEIEMRVGTRVGDKKTETVLSEAWEYNRPLPGRIWAAIKSWPARCVLRVVVWLARLFRRLFGRTAGERTAAGSRLPDLRRILDQYHTGHSNRVLVAGHTHRAGWYGDWYVNAGCWQGEQAHFVKIGCGGEVTLHRWPGRETDQTRLWPEAD